MKVIELFGKRWVIARTDDQLFKDTKWAMIEAESAMFVVRSNIRAYLDENKYSTITDWDCSTLDERRKALEKMRYRMIDSGLY